MATICTYKVYNGTSFDIYAFRTHVNAITTTDTKQFLTDEYKINGVSLISQKSFNLAGDTLSIQSEGGAGTIYDYITTEIANAKKYTDNAITNLDISNQLSNYLPLTGGTLTGALTGTSITTSTLNVTGSATINNLTVTGTTTTVNATNLEITDQVVVLGKNNTAALTKPAGLVVPKYDGTNYGGLFFDASGTAYVGDVGVDANGSILVTNSATTALPIAVRSGAVTTKAIGTNKYAAVFEKTSDGTSVQLNYKPYTYNDTMDFSSTTNIIATNTNLKAKVMSALTYNTSTEILSFTSPNGTSLGSIQLKSSIGLLDDDYTAQVLPTANAVKKLVKEMANKVYVQATQPTSNLRIGDIWIDTSAATTTI